MTREILETALFSLAVSSAAGHQSVELQHFAGDKKCGLWSASISVTNALLSDPSVCAKFLTDTFINAMGLDVKTFKRAWFEWGDDNGSLVAVFSVTVDKSLANAKE